MCNKNISSQLCVWFGVILVYVLSFKKEKLSKTKYCNRNMLFSVFYFLHNPVILYLYFDSKLNN